ncbi:melanoma-associated antigen B4-like [Delphinapterus leucas]|uniref:Melanoma-associated antigen B4-like n=1 Tax=Delphinapterus leucas TaxID=9749 RepID=A0A7F8KAT7_DELLE|nr:melanoma-associated antigen B4-like [Delphinapterus leucas]
MGSGEQPEDFQVVPGTKERTLRIEGTTYTTIRRQARRETQNLGGAQATAAQIEESPSCPSSLSRGTPPNSPAADTRQEPQGAPATSSRAAGVSGPGSDVRAKGQVQARKSSCRASASGESFQRDPLIKKVGMLIEFLLEKYTMEEPIIKADLLKLVNKRYKRKFPEILRRAAECVQLVFGLELKEVKPGGDSYALVSKLHVSDDGRQSSGGRFRKNGLLMLVLGVIFLHGDRASEEEIWEFLNGLGVYVGRCHIIFGEPRKLITEDLVQEKYLVYRQVRDSHLPCCELLWGRRAHAETSKMKVLEFMAKVTGTVPSALPDLYEEALKDEEERARARARARAAARAGTRVKASAPSKVMSSSSSHP